MTMLLSHTGIYRFCLAFAIFTAIADVNSFVGVSEYAVPIKYAYTAIIFILMFTYMCKWGVFDTTSPTPVLALMFFVITSATFVVNLLLYDTKASYVTAFTASLVLAAAIFIPPNSIVFDAVRVLKQLSIVFFVASAFVLLEAILKGTGLIKNYSYFPDMEHVKSIVCVFAICLSILMDRRVLTCILLLIVAATLVFRPASTLIVGLAICIPLSLLLKLRALGASRAIANTLLVTLIAGPLAFYFFFDDMANLVTAAEAYIKVDLLGGDSNTYFRLAILKFAFQALDQSFIYGNGLNGETSVLLARDFAWWREINQDGFAAIHSDFVVILTQAGIVGYLVFGAFLYLLLSVRFRMLVDAYRVDQNIGILISISIVGIVAFLIYASFNPFLPVYHCSHLVWVVLFISEMARKSILPGNVFAFSGNPLSPKLQPA